MTYQPRTYRNNTGSCDLVSFSAAISQTDLFISADKDLTKEAENSIKRLRSDIEGYINLYPGFETTLTPAGSDNKAPSVIKKMIKAAKSCNVGPMAGIAGAIAEGVGKDLLRFSSQVIVENGGDIFIASKEARIAGLYAGRSKFTNKIGIRIEPGLTPCGICTSSATVGHSLSFGKADAVVVLSRSVALADCSATALCNIISNKDDVDKVISHGKQIRGVNGILIVMGDTLGAWGDVKLVDI